MNTEQNNPIQPSAPYAPRPIPPRPEKKRVKFEKRDYLALLAAFVLALYPALAFYIGTLFAGYNFQFPGIGSAVFFLLVEGFGIFLCGKEKLRENRASLLPLAAGAACALSLGIWSYLPMRILNHFAAFALIAVGLLSLSCMNARPLSRPGVLGESFVGVFAASFAHMFKPFSAMPEAAGKKKGAIVGVVLGVLVSIPLIAIVVALLSSADSFFQSTVEGWARVFEDISIAELLWKGVRIVFFTLVLFSIFYALRHPKPVLKTDVRAPSVPASFTVTVLVLLAVLYVVFFGSVIIGLTFANLRDPAFFAEKGGYAQYAREGFFQLAAVAAINFFAVGIACYVNNKHRAVRALSVILSAETLVLLITAVVRMCCYIGAYGLSFLRLFTFLCMALIGCAMVLSLVKAFRPDFRIFPILACAAVILWGCFSLCDTSRLIARYNIDAYLSGQLERVDLDYISSLSPSVIPELERLAEKGSAVDAHNARAKIEDIRSDVRYPWWIWSVDRFGIGVEAAPVEEQAIPKTYAKIYAHLNTDDAVYILSMSYSLDGEIAGGESVMEASMNRPLTDSEYCFDIPESEDADLSTLEVRFSLAYQPGGREFEIGKPLPISITQGSIRDVFITGNAIDGYVVTMR